MKAVAEEEVTVLIVQRRDIDKLCVQDERFRQAILASGHSGTTDKENELNTVSLIPPEGVSAPSKFGLTVLNTNDPNDSAFSNLWHLQARNVIQPAPLAEGQVAQMNYLDGSSTECDLDILAKLSTTPDASPRHKVEPGSVGKPSSETTPVTAELPEDGEANGKSDPHFRTIRNHARESIESFEAQAHIDSMAPEDLPDLLASDNAAKAKSDDSGSERGHGEHTGHGRGVQAAIAIWLGILIDSVPESVVMGILVNTATQGTLVTFVCGVFLANFPEAMSSAGTMYAHGMRKHTIALMWASIVLCTGIGAFVGALIFPPGSTDDPDIVKVIAAIEGLCGGAMLCMIANTVLPEAFEQGGNVTGLSTLFGFLSAILVSVIQ